MQTSPTCYLSDLSLWLALAYDRHEHHPIVRRWFENPSVERLYFCRPAQLGLLRLLTNKSVMGPDVLSQTDAWGVFDRLRSDPRVGFQDESGTTAETLEELLRGHTRSDRSETKVWMDAYLVSLAMCSGLILATLDKGFLKFHGARIELIG